LFSLELLRLDSRVNFNCLTHLPIPMYVLIIAWIYVYNLFFFHLKIHSYFKKLVSINHRFLQVLHSKIHLWSKKVVSTMLKHKLQILMRAKHFEWLNYIPMILMSSRLKHIAWYFCHQWARWWPVVRLEGY